MDKKLWFKSKRYGWGWTPVTWQGWLITAVYAFLIISKAILIQNAGGTEKQIVIASIFWFVIYTAGLIFICYTKGERPRWRWGDSDKNQN